MWGSVQVKSKKHSPNALFVKATRANEALAVEKVLKKKLNANITFVIIITFTNQHRCSRTLHHLGSFNNLTRFASIHHQQLPTQTHEINNVSYPNLRSRIATASPNCLSMTKKEAQHLTGDVDGMTDRWRLRMDLQNSKEERWGLPAAAKEASATRYLLMVCDYARNVWCITGLMSYRVLLPSVSVLAIFLNSVRISPCRELRLHLCSVLFFFLRIVKLSVEG